MKPTNNVIACVIDYGNFICLADKLGETMKHVYYYSPICETEFKDINNCIFGEGVPTIERIDDFWESSVFNEVDLFIFPDIGLSGLQKHLVQCGKAVWGSRDVTDLELYRTIFLETLEQVGLESPKSKIIRGLAALDAALQKDRDKWIKIDIFRHNMETWKHIDYEHSQPMLRYLANTFGGVSEEITFIVQDVIKDTHEDGYDGFTIDGKYPKISFQGYEKKNEAYLGTWQKYDEMPESVKEINYAFAPIFKQHNYRNFWATEIRGDYFIDPTPRMAGQSQEHLLETCSNLSDIIWAGANGELVQPEFTAKFAGSLTLHYKEVPGEQWRAVTIPDKVKPWFKLVHYSQDGDTYDLPPGDNDELGVVIGNGDSIEEVIDEIRDHLEAVECEPICADVGEFTTLLDEIREAQENGVQFSKQAIPDNSIVLG